MAKRTSKPSSEASTPSHNPLDALFDDVSKNGLNLVYGEEVWKRLTAHGYELIPAVLDRIDGDKPFGLADLALQKLLETTAPESLARAAALLKQSLERDVQPRRRLAAIRAFQHGFAQDPGIHDRLLNIALDPGEDAAARATALEALAGMKPRGAQAERLLAILETNQEHWTAQDALREAVFLCLRRHALEIPSRQLLLRLEPLLTHKDARLRKRTIELIGAFGDLDIIEHLFALPDAPLHHREILDAVSAIARRPINLLSLRPAAFEAFIVRVLKRMGFMDVKLTRFSGDGGIDAECKRTVQDFDKANEATEKVIVQCKRYTEGLIGPKDIEEFAGKLLEHEAHHGIFITTTDYTRPARDYAKPRKNLRLVSGDDLIQRLATDFSDNRYTIRVHS